MTIATLAGVTPMVAQRPHAAQFVTDAVAAHLGVASERLALRRDGLAVARTGAARLPTLSFEAQWAELSGGADVGALVNPAFQALNQLTGSSDFPTDVSFRFPLEQDARVRLAMPIYDPRIGPATAASRAVRDAQAARLTVLERDVTLGIERGLLQWAAAAEVVRLREATLAALDEQLRAAERRADAGVDAADVVLRARADREEGAQLLLEAERSRDALRRAVNRMARRDLDGELPAVDDSTFQVAIPSSRAAAHQATVARAELAQAEASLGGARAGRSAARATQLPSFQIAVDYGFQGDRWRFTRDNDFAQLTLQARWTPLSFGRDARLRAEAALELERAELAQQDVRDQIRLEVDDAWEALATARAALAPAEARRVAALRTLELVRRRWDEGLASHLELVTARSSSTSAEVGAVLARYRLAESRLALARATASLPVVR